MTATSRSFTPGYAIRRPRGADAPAIAAVYEVAYPTDTDYPLVETSAVRSARTIPFC
jgi:hypothetical protein